MKTNIAELRSALQLIKSECENQGGTCTTCPMCIENGVHTMCGIVGREVGIVNGGYKLKPMYWKLPAIKLMEYLKNENV